LRIQTKLCNKALHWETSADELILVKAATAHVSWAFQGYKFVQGYESQKDLRWHPSVSQNGPDGGGVIDRFRTEKSTLLIGKTAVVGDDEEGEIER
jgi:hypothetical protein